MRNPPTAFELGSETYAVWVADEDEEVGDELHPARIANPTAITTKGVFLLGINQPFQEN